MTLCRVPQLVALLDADTCFPAAPFNSEEALSALARLGMQSIIGQESILQSARFIAELGLQDPDQAHERYLHRLNIPQLFLHCPCIIVILVRAQLWSGIK